MEWWIFFSLFVLTLISLMLLRVPVGIALLATSVGGSVILYGFAPAVRLSVLGMTTSLSTFNLVPVPLFILMGDLLFRAGIATSALDAISKLLGRMPARKAVLATAAGGLLGVVSGSPMATTAILGRTLVPQMVAAGYNHSLAMGSVLGSGGLAMIIPPSTLIVIFGATAGVPIGPLLVAGLVPGLLMAVNYAAVSMVWGGIFHGAPTEQVPKVSAGERLRVLTRDVLPLTSIVIMILGTILLGVATPSESAALGTLAAVGLVIVYRRFTWKLLWQAGVETAAVTGMVFLIVSAATIYGQVLAGSGASRGLAPLLSSAASSAGMAILLMCAITIVLGMFLEQIAIILLTVPFFMPLVAEFGIDEIWFGIIFMIVLQIGLTSPPFGMTLFVMKNYQPAGTRTVEVWRGALPYIGADCVTVTILFLVPPIVTFLPAAIT